MVGIPSMFLQIHSANTFLLRWKYISPTNISTTIYILFCCHASLDKLVFSRDNQNVSEVLLVLNLKCCISVYADLLFAQDLYHSPLWFSSLAFLSFTSSLNFCPWPSTCQSLSSHYSLSQPLGYFCIASMYLFVLESAPCAIHVN